MTTRQSFKQQCLSNSQFLSLLVDPYEGHNYTKISCMGSRDFCPLENSVSSDCPRGHDRVAGKADGIFVEHVLGLELKNVTFYFEIPWKTWFGDCLHIKDDFNEHMHGQDAVRCIHGPVSKLSSCSKHASGEFSTLSLVSGTPKSFQQQARCSPMTAVFFVASAVIPVLWVLFNRKWRRPMEGACLFVDGNCYERLT
jgi:hypothetical protein